MSLYQLRVLLGSWGLMVDLGLEARVDSAKPQAAIPIAPRVWLEVASSVQVGDLEMPHLLSGLRRIYRRIAVERSVGGEHLVFVLNHLWFPLTDCQDDAVELAVVGWAAEELGFDAEPASVSFDRASNRYLIQYNEASWEAER